MKKLALVILFALVLYGVADAQHAPRSSWNEGDLKMDKFSIDGDSSDGLAFDPDSDGTNEIVMNADGTMTIGAITLPADDGNADQVLVSDGLGTLSWATQSGSSSGGIQEPIDISSDTTVTGILTHEHGGLEVDASSYNGFLTISGGSTSARVLNAGDIPDISATYEVQLNDEAGLYAVLSDVTQFYEAGDTVANATEAAGVALGYEASDTTCYPLFAESTSSPTAASYNTNFKFNSSSRALECADLNLTDDLSVQDSILAYGDISGNNLSVSNNLSVGALTITQAGKIIGASSVDSTTENTVEDLIFDADAENVTGVWENADDIARVFGSDADASINFDATDDVLEVKGKDVRIGDSGVGTYVDGDGDLLVEDELEVGGNAFFSDNVTIEGDLSVGDTLFLLGTGDATIDSPNGIVIFNDDVQVTGDWTLGSTLTQDGGNAYYKGTEIGSGTSYWTDEGAYIETVANGIKAYDNGSLELDSQLTTGGNNVINFTSLEDAELQIDSTLVMKLTTSEVNSVNVTGSLILSKDLTLSDATSASATTAVYRLYVDSNGTVFKCATAGV